MDKQQLTKLIDKGYTIQKIADELKSSFTNVRYYLRKYGLNTKTYENENLTCKCCGGALKGRQTHYCSKKCKMKELSPYYNQTATDRVRKRGLERKIMFVKQLGGKCQSCGYDKNLSALTFHHTNPDNKLITLDVRKMTNTNLQSLTDEVKKCKLLCHNCHTEHHHPMYNDWKMVGGEGFKPPVHEL